MTEVIILLGCPSVCPFLVNISQEHLQCPFEVKDELNRIWWAKVKITFTPQKMFLSHTMSSKIT